MWVGSEFAVCSLVGCCVGVSYGGKQGEVVVSFKAGAVQVYNVHDLRMVCSWQLPSSERLTCAAVVQPFSLTYWAVSSQGVMEWAREDNVMAVSSHKLGSSQNPMKLLPCGRRVVVVYANGEVQCLGQGTCSLVPKRAKKWMLVMAEVSCDKNICVVGVEQTVTIGIAESADGKLKPPVAISMQPNRIDLVSSCVCKDKLLLLFETGELMMVLLEPPLHPVTCVLTVPSPVALSTAHLLAVSAQYFAVLYQNSLQVWDAHYFTCHEEAEMAVESNSKVWCVEGCLYVWKTECGELCGHKVEGKTAIASLSNALGKRPVRSITTTSTLSSWPVTSEEMDENVDMVNVQDYLHSLASKVKTPHLQSFMSVFGSRELSPDLCYYDIIERLLCEDAFWGWEALLALLQAGLVPSNVDILSEAIKREDWSLAYTCLSHPPTPHENSIVHALEKFLYLPESVVGWNGAVLLKRDFICRLLCQPFTDVFMQAPLASLPIQVVKDLLLLLSEHVSLSSLLTLPRAESPIPYDVVLEWIGLIVDVHFISLTLDQDCQQLLLLLQSQILTQVACYTRLSVLSSLD